MVLLKDKIWSYSNLLKSGGVELPEKDLKLLICFALEINPLDYYFTLNKTLSRLQQDKIEKYIKRRILSEPVSKILGKKSFWALDFVVNQHVLDPRPETEIIIETVKTHLKAGDFILDLGTGSGCLAVTIASLMKSLNVHACDISSKALAVAKKNAELNTVNVKFFESNWFSNVKQTYDVICCNPPYISKSDFNLLPRDVQFYDPKIALFGGLDGLDCYRRIAEKIFYYMNYKGLAFFEVGIGQMYAVKKIFSKRGFKRFSVWKDLSGIERVLCVKKDA